MLTKPKSLAVLLVALLALTALVSASAAASEMIPRNDAERKRALAALSVVWGPNEIYFKRAAAAFDLPAKTTIALGQNGRLLLGILTGAKSPGLLGVVRVDRRTTMTIGYRETGFVDLTDARSVDTDKLIEALRANAAQDNARRSAAGLFETALPTWLTPPQLDPTTMSVFWAVRSGEKVSLTSFHFGRRGVAWTTLTTSGDLADVDSRAIRALHAGFRYEAGMRHEDHAMGDAASRQDLLSILAANPLAD